KDWEKKCGIYKTELIQSAINDMWFANRSDEGIVYAKYFDPLPIQTIALILTALECCIDEWMTGVKEDIKFSSVAYSPVYLLHLNSLQRFEERTAAYKLLGKIGVDLLDVAQYVSDYFNLLMSFIIQTDIHKKDACWCGSIHGSSDYR
ncbi:hypothetical protein F4604DRAFT_1564880, partial [Suillus subluteus]